MLQLSRCQGTLAREEHMDSRNAGGYSEKKPLKPGKRHLPSPSGLDIIHKLPLMPLNNFALIKYERIRYHRKGNQPSHDPLNQKLLRS